MKNKVLYLVSLAILGVSSVKAQLNVGSTSATDASAILQATSTTKGFLPPVMTTTQINAIALPANGLTVYNSTLSQLQVNVGTPAVPSWSVAAGGANVYWSQLGNTGSVPGTNYVGTTDNSSLGFRTNGVERVRIDSATGRLGIGTTTPVAKLDIEGNIRLATTVGGATTDSLLTINNSTGIINKRSVASVGNQGGIYSNDGTLSGARNVNLAGNILSLSGGNVLMDSILSIDNAQKFNGHFAPNAGPSLRFGGYSSGEGIASNRTGGLNTTGIDLFTLYTPRMSITNSGLVGINTQTPTHNLELNGNMGISSSNILEFGSGVAGKEINAGKIGYGNFSSGASLDIVGAGTVAGTRKIQLIENVLVGGTLQVVSLPASTATQIVTTDGSGNLGQRTLKPTVFGSGNNSVNNITLNSSTTSLNYTGWAITIPALSKYQVNVQMLLLANSGYTNNTQLLITGIFSTTQPSFTSYDGAYGYGYGNSFKSIANVYNNYQTIGGIMYVNNTTASAVTLYLFLNSYSNNGYTGNLITGYPSNQASEDLMIGTPMY